jgi:hypothetical protein
VSILSLGQVVEIPQMLGAIGYVLPIWFEQFTQQQVDLINGVLMPFGAAPLAPVDFGVDLPPGPL